MLRTGLIVQLVLCLVVGHCATFALGSSGYYAGLLLPDYHSTTNVSVYDPIYVPDSEYIGYSVAQYGSVVSVGCP